jgi:hypothetical protein
MMRTALASAESDRSRPVKTPALTSGHTDRAPNRLLRCDQNIATSGPVSVFQELMFLFVDLETLLAPVDSRAFTIFVTPRRCIGLTADQSDGRKDPHEY